MPPPADLFISEYIEGTSNNKAIEVYNGTGSPINLGTGGYVLQLYSNGVGTPSVSYNMSGVLVPGAVYVVAHPGANSAILSVATDSSLALIGFNGDDAFVLRKGGLNGTILDAIGQIGFDPGTQWGTPPASTLNTTLVRKSTICGGDTIGTNAFDPAAEWDAFAVDTFSNLGSHTLDCGVTAAETSISGRVAMPDGQGIRNVRVIVFGGDLAAPRTVMTSTFGYYRFDGLTAGQTYVVNVVGGKQFVFEVSSRVIALGDEAFDVDFIGERR